MRLIDADTFDVISTKAPDGVDTDSYIAGIAYVVSKIDAQPTIEERKTGKWVGIQAYCDHMNETTVGSRFIPSGMVCGVYCNQCWERNSEKKNFCPNCGARMES